MSTNEISHYTPQVPQSSLSRRAFLTRAGMAAVGALLLPSADAFAKVFSKERKLSFHNLNTDEELTFFCCPQQHYDRRTLSRFNYFLRDHRTDSIHAMDPALLDLLYAISAFTGSRGTFQVVSGYRSPETNRMLRKISRGVAEHSMHMEGRAIDIRMSDVNTRTIQKAALALQQGGVGYYRRSNFVHLDTGRVRSW
ncbi:YcbK family protein [Methylocaldum sp. MU1018]